MKITDESTGIAYHFMWSRDRSRIVVDAYKKDCGRHFSNVAEIEQVQSLNPLFRFPKPLGMKAIKFIMSNYLGMLKND